MIKIPSEGNRDNPVEDVLFYKKTIGKNHPPTVLTDKEIKDMVRSLICSYYRQNYACSEIR